MNAEEIKTRSRQIVSLKNEADELDAQRRETVRKQRALEAETAAQIATEAGYRLGEIMTDPENYRFVVTNFELQVNYGTLYFGMNTDYDPADAVYGVTVILTRVTKKGTLGLHYDSRQRILLRTDGAVSHSKNRPEIKWTKTGEIYQPPAEPAKRGN